MVVQLRYGKGFHFHVLKFLRFPGRQLPTSPRTKLPDTVDESNRLRLSISLKQAPPLRFMAAASGTSRHVENLVHGAHGAPMPPFGRCRRASCHWEYLLIKNVPAPPGGPCTPDTNSRIYWSCFVAGIIGK
jgi:hypothetical protein